VADYSRRNAVTVLASVTIRAATGASAVRSAAVRAGWCTRGVVSRRTMDPHLYCTAGYSPPLIFMTSTQMTGSVVNRPISVSRVLRVAIATTININTNRAHETIH